MNYLKASTLKNSSDFIKSELKTDHRSKYKTLKPLGEKIGENLHDFGFGDEVLDTLLIKMWSKKVKIDMFGFIKIKNYCYVKDSVKRMKWQVTDWQNTFARYKSDKELVNKIYKQLSKLNNRKLTTQLINGQKIWMDTLPNIVANKHMKRYPTSFVNGKIQIKMTIQYQHTPIRMA